VIGAETVFGSAHVLTSAVHRGSSDVGGTTELLGGVLSEEAPEPPVELDGGVVVSIDADGPLEAGPTVEPPDPPAVLVQAARTSALIRRRKNFDVPRPVRIMS
jgi:hypothetical protein